MTTVVAGRLQNWTDVLDVVEENSGIYMITMETLRQLEGAQRLGVHVLTSIVERLRTLGIGHMPETLPNRQEAEVILYRFGTPAHEVIRAVRADAPTGSAYEALWRLNTVPEPSTVVDRDELEQVLVPAQQVLLELMQLGGRFAPSSGLEDDDVVQAELIPMAHPRYQV